MGLSQNSLLGLRTFLPSSLENSLELFEFLKYETKRYRNEDIISKDELFESYSNVSRVKQKENTTKTRRSFEEFAIKLDSSLFLKNGKNDFSDIKWNRIDEFCNLLRLIERSDERKIRWALYYLFCSGKKESTIEVIGSILGKVKTSNIEKQLKKILKIESAVGLDAIFDGKILKINHDVNDKIVWHYLADAIGEVSRRSPGELEEQILKLLDEGSYSNQEIAKVLQVDEAMISRSISKLRSQEKITLSSFGEHGTRYFTTNCDNCPFGTTKAACRKESLSYIIGSFAQDYNIELNANDFEEVETNQALLKIKRIIMMTRKDKNTRLERNLNSSLSKLLGKIVEKSLQVQKPIKKNRNSNFSSVKIETTPILSKLPSLYQLGLLKGAEEGIRLINDILQIASRSIIKKEDRLQIKKQAVQETNKFLEAIGFDMDGKNNT